MKIKNIHAREILDSRGYPTISTTIELWSGDKGTGDVPSGASTGKTEVLELRDGDANRYGGKGVLKAVEIVNTTIKEAVLDREFTSQKEFDDLLKELDGTDLKTKLGGNSILSASMAFCRATANTFGLDLYEYFGMIYWDEEYRREKLEMPKPMILVMEGGKHGNWATDIQEFMITPNMEKFDSFADILRAGSEIFHAIHDILNKMNYSVGVGYEGAFAPKELKSNEEAFEIIVKGIEKAGYKPYEEFEIALDVASSEFFDEEKNMYILRSENKELTVEAWEELQMDWYSKYPIYSIEDPMDQSSWEDWSNFVERYGDKYQIVGDDLLTTNPKRIRDGIQKKAMNAVLIKLNQIGTVSETLDAIRLTVENGMNAVISHRSGETNDNMIADLVVGTPAQECKFGGPDRGERLAKYNRLLEIEEELKNPVEFEMDEEDL
jgi:enolase